MNPAVSPVDVTEIQADGGLLPGVQATRWLVLPVDIDECPLEGASRHFAIAIALKIRDGVPCFVVSQDEMTGWTKHGKTVWLRHDVNGKHARHATFEQAQRLAYDIANGHLKAEGYTHWRERMRPLASASNQPADQPAHQPGADR